jgi:cardiolipin synthase
MASWAIIVAFVAMEIAVVAAVISVLRRPREPRAMLAWILALVLLPGLGLLLFLLIGEPRVRWHRKRRRRRRKRLEPYLARHAAALESRELTDPVDATAPPLRRLGPIAERLGAFAATHGNDVQVYFNAEQTFLALELAIEAAQLHVHLEYYIFQADEAGTAVRDLLIAKAESGVQCRVLLDFVGCWRLSRRFLRPMRDAGVEVAFMLPVIPWRGRWRVNFRNHRKIAVIDGRIGFTGSQNIGDEYRGRRHRSQWWRDTHLKIQGPAVHHLQEVFVEDWHYATRKDLVTDGYFPIPEAAGRRIVQIVPSGPDQPIRVMDHLLHAALGAATTSISIITPYFVPAAPFLQALLSAVYRGVQVRLLVPTCTDHPVVLWAGRSFYERLITAGVEIYEHDETMLHSKTMVIDGAWAMVGSANMDERSFRINFEVTTMLFSEDLAQELYRDFEALRTRSRPVTLDDVRARSFVETLLVGMARLASPLL